MQLQGVTLTRVRLSSHSQPSLRGARQDTVQIRVQTLTLSLVSTHSSSDCIGPDKLRYGYHYHCILLRLVLYPLVLCLLSMQRLKGPKTTDCVDTISVF